ncbi:nucleotidyltransferase family protein [Bacillus luteolus]|uniref:Nucleotidyltransferase family protein n=1 Tax=Litchfieldia luteola TaxID=682179 RepID=A0ABR9QHJ7_9BACI|nr:nucleotidyltransferase family protein [Cytobacillus luteolus]MBE4907975.1 nucleotidyltransferase family protein [Cytobacillus luteolus]MBP1942757.1 NDP-sugar pyrophosphorylase family protein [Cytobacillus luteolus]
MKGVIIAGGKGKRLRPLTDNLPKPMVPLLNKPVMEYSIDLLKQHGITSIAITTHYLSKNIKDYFGDGSRLGVSLSYFHENQPMGTAGGIQNAKDFLNEPFIVVSGDILTDINLTEAIQYHLEKGALLTILLKEVENPLQYGLVQTDDKGIVCRFLEKPLEWEDVFTNTVNTGIYIVSPNIFSYWGSETFYDFSHDLFPKLIENKEGLYGFLCNGYWSDIGCYERYRQTELDLLESKVKVKVVGKPPTYGFIRRRMTQKKYKVRINKSMFTALRMSHKK